MAPMSAMSALVLGIGVAPFGAAGGKEPPSSWSCARPRISARERWPRLQSCRGRRQRTVRHATGTSGLTWSSVRNQTMLGFPACWPACGALVASGSSADSKYQVAVVGTMMAERISWKLTPEANAKSSDEPMRYKVCWSAASHRARLAQSQSLSLGQLRSAGCTAVPQQCWWAVPVVGSA